MLFSNYAGSCKLHDAIANYDGLKSHVAFNEWPRIFVSIKLAENFRIIANHNL